jgi:hypothetical protein
MNSGVCIDIRAEITARRQTKVRRWTSLAVHNLLLSKPRLPLGERADCRLLRVLGR